MNYFAILCFAWAALGLVTRVLIVGLRERWAKWETEQVYTAKRPRWLIPVGLAGAALVAVTWYLACTSGVRGGWVAAALLSLILLKIGAFLFRYDDFLAYVRRILREPDLLRGVNLLVTALSLALLALGAWYLR